MIEFTPTPLPIPSHQIPSELYIDAAQGRYDNKTSGMLLLSYVDVAKQKPSFVNLLNNKNDDLFLLLDNAEIVDTENVILKELGKGGSPRIHFLFYNSIMPNIFIDNSITGDWYLGKSLTKDLRLKSSQSGNLGVLNNSQSGNIMIEDNSQIGNIFTWDGSQRGNILIKNNSQGGLISTMKSKSGNLDIENNSQSRGISIDAGSQSGFIRIRGNSQIGDINFWLESQGKFISVDKKSLCGNISIQDSQLTFINIENQYIGLTFKNSTVSHIHILNCHLHKLAWHYGSKGELYMNMGSLNHLALQSSALLKDSVFLFNHVAMHIIQIESLLVQGQLMLRDVTAISQNHLPLWAHVINGLEIHQSNNMEISELSVKIKENYLNDLSKKKASYEGAVLFLKKQFQDGPLFRIADSSLGKTEITGSDLREFNFEYRDSKLLECFLSGTQLPKNGSNITKSGLKIGEGRISVYQNEDPKTDKENKDYYMQMVSFYNQLRKLYESLGDIVEASLYQSKAMDNQQRLLRLNYQLKHNNQLKGRFSNEGFDLFNFWLNKISNNHGESWRQALVFFLIISFSFYSAYYFSLFHQESFTCQGVGEFLGDFFDFLDITHKQNFLVDKQLLNPFSKAIDFFGRLLMGYAIYQFIVAFRRHGRKGL
jgi:hypothetical protein